MVPTSPADPRRYDPPAPTRPTGGRRRMSPPPRRPLRAVAPSAADSAPFSPKGPPDRPLPGKRPPLLPPERGWASRTPVHHARRLRDPAGNGPSPRPVPFRPPLTCGPGAQRRRAPIEPRTSRAPPRASAPAGPLLRSARFDGDIARAGTPAPRRPLQGDGRRLYAYDPRRGSRSPPDPPESWSASHDRPR